MQDSSTVSGLPCSFGLYCERTAMKWRRKVCQ
jgi:hypothetical protein